MNFKEHRDSGRKRAHKMHGGKDAKKAVHEHEDHLHKGEKKTKIKLKTGGHVDGKKAEKRMDKPVRGGRQALKTGGKSKHKGGTKVNVIVAGSPGGGAGGPPMGGMRPPMPPGMAPPNAMPPRPPMAPPPGGGGMPMPPPGGAPGMPPKPPGMMNKGGRINTKIKAPKMEDGAGGGKGRLEKAKKYGATPLARGGSCESEE